MSDTLYTTLSTVGDELKIHYMHNHEYEDFSDAVLRLYTCGKLSSAPLKFRRANKFLNVEEFHRHIYSQVVIADCVLDNLRCSTINETNTIPFDRDIFTIAHLAYQIPIWHIHDFFEIVYIYSGSCTLQLEKESQDFHSGDFFLIAPGTKHRVVPVEGSTIPGIYLRQSTFEQTFLQLLKSDDLLSAFFKRSLYNGDLENYLLFHINEPTELNGLIQQIFDETNIDVPYSNLIAISLMNVFFGKILRDYGKNITIHADFSTKPFDNDFPMMLRYVQSNYNTITLSKLSEVFHYSEVYISLMFKKKLNQNFSQILQELRLSHAKDYLENTSDSVYTIAQQIGYSSADHFSRIFKKKYNLSPSEYRKHL